MNYKLTTLKTPNVYSVNPNVMKKDSFLKISVLITSLLIFFSILFNLKTAAKNYCGNKEDAIKQTLIDELIEKNELSSREALFYD